MTAATISRVSELANKAIDNTLAAMALSKGSYIDDHGHSKTVHKAQAVAKFTRGSYVGLVLLFDKNIFSINPLEVRDDGEVHLRTSSVGGVVYAKDKTLEEGIEAYNAQSTKGDVWYCGTIGEIIRF